MPEPKGKAAVVTTFVDASLMHDLIMGRSVTGVIHMLNKTPIEWFCKRQNQVETATYGSEFMAMRIAVEQIIELRHMLCMLGVSVEGPSCLFGGNESVVINRIVPSSTLKKCWNALLYHQVREEVASKVVNVAHMPGELNPADVLTKFLHHRKNYGLMKEFLFWAHDRSNLDQDEGSVKSG